MGLILNDDEKELLWHTLGMKRVNYRNALAWWLNNDNHRNHFAADLGHDDNKTLLGLVDRGLMKRGRDIPGGLVYFHVTPEGIAVAKDAFKAYVQWWKAAKPR